MPIEEGSEDWLDLEELVDTYGIAAVIEAIQTMTTEDEEEGFEEDGDDDSDDETDFEDEDSDEEDDVPC